MEDNNDIIAKMIEDAFQKGKWEEDDMKRASIYGKCLNKIQKLINNDNKNS